MGGWPAPTDRGAAHGRSEGALRSERALGLGSWDYGWVFSFRFGFPQILFCILNTNGKRRSQPAGMLG